MDKQAGSQAALDDLLAERLDEQVINAINHVELEEADDNEQDPEASGNDETGVSSPGRT